MKPGTLCWINRRCQNRGLIGVLVTTLDDPSWKMVSDGGGEPRRAYHVKVRSRWFESPGNGNHWTLPPDCLTPVVEWKAKMAIDFESES